MSAFVCTLEGTHTHGGVSWLLYMKDSLTERKSVWRLVKVDALVLRALALAIGDVHAALVEQTSRGAGMCWHLA